MGLDSYIIKRIYYVDPGNVIKSSEDERFFYVAHEVAYWRRAWPIHNWFVKNVQDGVDNCADYYIHIKKLEEFLSIVEAILSSKDREEEAWRLLPPSGFIDDYYFEHLETAKTAIEKILQDQKNMESISVSYHYCSSW